MTKRPTKTTKLQISIASVFTDVVGVSKLDGPDDDVQFMDLTDLNSGVALEDGELTGHVAPGSVSGQLFWDPADSTHQVLTGLMAAPAKRDWKIVNTAITGYAETFTGTLKQFKVARAVKAALVADFEIKLAGLPTRTYSA